jgi:hypothetical protein
MNKHTVSVYVVMGDAGGYEVGVDEGTALDRFEQSFTGRHRVVKLNVTMAAPDLGETDVEVPDEYEHHVEADVEEEAEVDKVA